MGYKPRINRRITNKDKLGECKVCKKLVYLRWVYHPKRKYKGYHSSVCRECRSLQERTRRRCQKIQKDKIIKICNKCGKENPHRFISDSRNTNGGYYQKHCQYCHNATSVIRYRELKMQAINYLGNKCFDCGIQDSCIDIYDFHHRNPEDKKYSIGILCKNKSILSFDDIKEEIDKCDLLCANCHRKRHSGFE